MVLDVAQLGEVLATGEAFEDLVHSVCVFVLYQNFLVAFLFLNILIGNFCGGDCLLLNWNGHCLGYCHFVWGKALL